MPDGWPQNSDVNDLAQRGGDHVLAALLESATKPPQPEPRYKLLGADDLRNLPPLAWRVRGELPAVGLAGLYGPSASGKSFLALDMAAAIAEGRHWFDCRVNTAPVSAPNCRSFTTSREPAPPQQTQPYPLGLLLLGTATAFGQVAYRLPTS